METFFKKLSWASILMLFIVLGQMLVVFTTPQYPLDFSNPWVWSPTALLIVSVVFDLN